MQVNNNCGSKVQLSQISSNISSGGTTVSYGIRQENVAGENINRGTSSYNWQNNQNQNAQMHNQWQNNQNQNAQMHNQWQNNQNQNAQIQNEWQNNQNQNTQMNNQMQNNQNQLQSSAQVHPTISAVNYNEVASGAYNNQQKQFNQSNRIQGFNQEQLWQPSVDISETSNDIVISAYVSNEIMDDISLNVSEDSVAISGSVWNGNQGIALRRIIPLSTSVRAEACDASLQSGSLEIRLPKTEKINRNKTILSENCCTTR